MFFALKRAQKLTQPMSLYSGEKTTKPFPLICSSINGKIANDMKKKTWTMTKATHYF